MATKKITKDMKFSEILSANSDSAELLFELGMHCMGCPMAMQETLEEGALAHGMNKNQIDELLKKLNGGKKKAQTS